MTKGPRPGDRTTGSKLLAGTACSIVAAARHALTDPNLPRFKSIHDVRKAFKRWRALMRLLEDQLGQEARRMRAEARGLMRKLAPARDFQSALDAARDLRKGNPRLSEASLHAINQRLTELRDTAEAMHFNKAIRMRLLRYLDVAAVSLERWPLASIDIDTIADGLSATYRRARKRVPKKWRQADAESLHALRRRVVEHRYQMDMIKPSWPHLGKERSDKAQRLRQRLGACQDLAMLANFAAPRRPLAAWRSQIERAIQARRAAHLKAAARISGKLFAEKPKIFRQKITVTRAARRKKR